MSAASSHPRLVEDCDWRSLPLGPTEAFILSRIDGRSPVADLAIATGLPEATVQDSLRRLEELGAIVFGDHPRRRSTPNESGVEARSEPPADPMGASTSLGARARRSSPKYDPALLDAPGDLPRETKAEILETFAILSEADHYQLLGLSRHAEKAEIKKAYFEKVSRFHTDRFYGKDLGEFRGKLDRIFGALTKAHDTLARKKSRAEYDRYLASREATLGARESVVPRPKTQPPSQPPEKSFPDAPRAPRVEAASPAPNAPNGPQSRRTPDPQAARRLLARKLDSTRGGRRSSSQPPPSTSKEDIKRAVSDDLRKRYQARTGSTGQQKARYLRMSEQALQEGQWSSALNSLKLALAVDPDDDSLRIRIEETQEQADLELADKFLEQGRYEEKDGHYDRAARSYERAARGKNKAEYYCKASVCLQKAGGNRRKAVEMARQAVQLDTSKAHHHIVLAKAYLEVDMTTSALAEVGRALELAPDNEEALRLRKALK